jgi:hypothetical protein
MSVLRYSVLRQFRRTGSAGQTVQQPSQTGGLVGATSGLRLPLHLVDACAGVLQGDHGSFSVTGAPRL